MKILNLKLVTMWQYQNRIIFAKGHIPNCSEEVSMINKVKNTVPWTYAIEDINGEEIVGMFYEKV